MILYKKDLYQIINTKSYQRFSIYNFIIVFLPYFECNYKCNYCYVNIFKNKNFKYSKEKFQKQIEFFDYLTQITPKKRRLDISGGEPTYLFDEFLIPFCKKYYKDWDLFLFTNLSLSKKKLKFLLNKNYIKEFTISPHFHQIQNFNEFIEKVNIILDYNIDIQFKILFENKYNDKIQYILEKYSNYDNILFDFKLLNYKDKILSKDYNFYQNIINKYKDKNSDILIKYKNKINFPRQIRNEINVKNSICNAGKKYLVLDQYGNLFPCETYQLQYWYYEKNNKYIILNIFKNGIYQLKLKQQICKLQICFADLWLN